MHSCVNLLIVLPRVTAPCFVPTSRSVLTPGGHFMCCNRKMATEGFRAICVPVHLFPECQCWGALSIHLAPACHKAARVLEREANLVSFR